MSGKSAPAAAEWTAAYPCFLAYPTVALSALFAKQHDVAGTADVVALGVLGAVAACALGIGA